MRPVIGPRQDETCHLRDLPHAVISDPRTGVADLPPVVRRQTADGRAHCPPVGHPALVGGGAPLATL